MKVSECEKCEFYERRVWTRYYKPLNYHAIGNNHAYGYCTAYDTRCLSVRRCDMERGIMNEEYMCIILKQHEKNLLDEEYRYAHNGMRLPLKLDLEETRLLIKALEVMRGEEIEDNHVFLMGKGETEPKPYYITGEYACDRNKCHEHEINDVPCEECECCADTRGGVMVNEKPTWVLELIRDRACKSQAEVDVMNEAIELMNRKEGKWIESNPKNSEICRLVKCSNCGDTYIVNINIPLELWATKNRNYCGACGAKMSNAYDSE